MKVLIKVLFCFVFIIHIHSQDKEKALYLLINKKDTLIYKQVATKTNSYEGYVITDETRLVKGLKSAGSSKEIIPYIVEYDTFTSYSFSFDRQKDTIVSKEYLDKLKIKHRREFIDLLNSIDLFSKIFIFIEPLKNGKYILRKVYSVESE